MHRNHLSILHGVVTFVGAVSGSLKFPGFQVHDGGGATINGVTVTSKLNGNKFISISGDSGSSGWRSISVNRERAGVIGEQAGAISVTFLANDLTLHRRYIPSNHRVLVNDTFSCQPQPHQQQRTKCSLYTNHTFVLPAGKQAEVQLNGGFDAPQLGECSSDIVRGTNGNPSVVASFMAPTSTFQDGGGNGSGAGAGGGGGGGVGVMPLDDVFRAHAYLANRASQTRIPGHTACTISDPPAFDVVDPYLALSPGQTYTAEWAIYTIEAKVAPADVRWTFANRLRDDLGVNNITLRGGGTLASWETEILNAGNWTSGGGCSMNASIHGQGAVCFPTWEDDTLRKFMEYQGIGVVISDIMRMETPWKKCEDNVTTRDYCYGSCGSVHEYSNWTATYLHRMSDLLERINFNGKKLLYMHPFISTETGAAKKYADDRQLTSAGAQVCDYSGEYVGTIDNVYGKQLLDFVAVAMDTFGFDGIYCDESSYGATPLDFNPLRDDKHSAIIDPTTFEIVRPVSFVPLLWQGLQAKIFDEVTARGGTLVANSFPVTRTMTETTVRNNVLHFAETSAKGREIWGWTSTPVGLAKALFQNGDPDPTYANVTGLPVDNLWADLDFGCLTYMYDMLLPNITGWNDGGEVDGKETTPKVKSNVMQFIFPTTPVTLGQGWIVGRERIVTKVARTFTFLPARLVLRYFDRQGWLTSTTVQQGPTVAVSLDAHTNSFAVIMLA